MTSPSPSTGLTRGSRGEGRGGTRIAWRTQMAAILIGNWWALALRGVAAILFAIIAFIMPGITAEVVILLFGAYALIDGIFALVAGLRAAHRHGRSTALLAEGTLNIVIGIIVFL